MLVLGLLLSGFRHIGVVDKNAILHSGRSIRVPECTITGVVKGEGMSGNGFVLKLTNAKSSKAHSFRLSRQA